MNWRRGSRTGVCLPSTEWFWNFRQAALAPRLVNPAKRSPFVIPQAACGYPGSHKCRRSNALRSRIRLRLSGMTTTAIRCRERQWIVTRKAHRRLSGVLEIEASAFLAARLARPKLHSKHIIYRSRSVLLQERTSKLASGDGELTTRIEPVMIGCEA